MLVSPATLPVLVDELPPVLRRRRRRRPGPRLRQQAFTERGRDRRPHTPGCRKTWAARTGRGLFAWLGHTGITNNRGRGVTRLLGRHEGGLKACASSSLFFALRFEGCYTRSNSPVDCAPVPAPHPGPFPPKRHPSLEAPPKTRNDSIAGPPRCPPFLPSVVYPSFGTVLSGRRQQRQLPCVSFNVFVCVCACVLRASVHVWCIPKMTQSLPSISVSPQKTPIAGFL